MLTGGETSCPKSKLMGLGSYRTMQLRRKFAEPFRFCSLLRVTGVLILMGYLLRDYRIQRWQGWRSRFHKKRHLGLSSFNGDKAPGPDGFSMAFLAIFVGVCEERGDEFV